MIKTEMKNKNIGWKDFGRIPENGKRLNNSKLLFILPGLIAIYGMIFPIMLIDLCSIIYQGIYFRVFDIPFIKRSEYIKLDRWKLKGLNPWQKLNCIYCGYANGVAAWSKDLVAQTEIYSCGIKHNLDVKGQNHQDNFYEREVFN